MKAEEIPLGARIIAVADSYDAMVSERPYRHAMDIDTACLELERYKNLRFDSRIVDAFMLGLQAPGKAEPLFNGPAKPPDLSGIFNSTMAAL